jgi:hypothetical protein
MEVELKGSGRLTCIKKFLGEILNVKYFGEAESSDRLISKRAKIKTYTDPVKYFHGTSY